MAIGGVLEPEGHLADKMHENHAFQQIKTNIELTGLLINFKSNAHRLSFFEKKIIVLSDIEACLFIIYTTCNGFMFLL